MITVAIALAGRELKRFIRQPQRVIGAIGQPLLFWIFFGAGFQSSFHAPGLDHVSYLEYFYPGIMMMMMLFASIFSSITIIEDRDAGFLQSVLVAPVSRLSIVLGKVLGGTAIAMGQTLIFSIAAPFLGLFPSLGSWFILFIAFLLSGMAFSALGFFFAWPMKSTAGFHAIMMVFLMPLWMLSGAFFPIDKAPLWLHFLMTINPVSHALRLVRSPLYFSVTEMITDPAYLTSLAITILWLFISFYGSIWQVLKKEQGALRSLSKKS